jgi:hypothetical protein
MNAFKFLATGRRGLFSGFTWPEDEWVDTSSGPTACRSGVHACLPQHLAYWLLPELWRVELDGEVVETPLKIVATRGRLVEAVDAWDEVARRDFMAESVRRTVRYAVLELRAVGLDAAADELESADDASLETAAESVLAAAAAARERDAADLAGYVGDAVAYAAVGHLAGPPLIAARAAALHSPEGVDDPFAAEREAQGLFLAERLELTGAA